MKKILLYLISLVVALFALMALFPEDTATLAVNLERSASSLEHKTVVIGGETWHYLEGGPEDAEVLLLIHGFVQALDLKQFHVAGNSMGGHLATLYTHRYPQEVMSLGLVDNAGVDVPVESDFWRALAKGENPLIAETVEEFDLLLSFAAHKEPFVPWPIKGVFARRAIDHAESNHAIFDAYKSDRSAGLEPALEEIEKPVLILWGEFDRILDVSSVDVMRPLLPQAEVTIMKDTGHIPMLERPAETAAHYLRFLASLQT